MPLCTWRQRAALPPKVFQATLGCMGWSVAVVVVVVVVGTQNPVSNQVTPLKIDVEPKKSLN